MLQNKHMKKAYSSEKIRLYRISRGTWRGLGVSRKLTLFVDQFLLQTLERRFEKANPAVAVFALGGYGRAELNLHSDVDLLFVTEDTGDPSVRRALQSTVQELWDSGLEIGHQVMNPEQVLELLRLEWTFRTTLLEMRFLWGNQTLAAGLEKRLRYEGVFAETSAFLRTVLEETTHRHQKFGNSPQLLEPDLKNGVGGLRDLHALLWLFRGHPDFSGGFEIRRTPEPSVPKLLQQFFENDFLPRNDFYALQEAFEFLLTVRNELHFVTGQHADRLEYRLQKTVAKNLGYTDSGERLAVEQFLRDYYLHTRKIFHTYQILSELFSPDMPALIDRKAAQKKERLAPKIAVIESALVLEGEAGKIFQDDPALFMKIFRWQQERGLRLGEFLRSHIYQEIRRVPEGFQKNPEVVRLFLEILSEPKNLGRTLRVMHELDVLDRFLPEFSAITALAQHDLYHYFSADEHTLLAIENVAKLADATEDPFDLRKTLFEIPEKQVLFLGLLFHDIGKAVPGAHTRTGVTLAREIFARWNVHGELEEQVLFLIANHLKMEQFAFRRNSDDPSTLQQFAKIVGNVSNLRLLYLLTYGDLSALNPTLWSEWKAIQLWELFRKTRRYLEGQCVAVPLSEKELRKLSAEIAAEAGGRAEEEDVLSHLEQLGVEYLKFFENREIARHLELIKKLEKQPAAIDFQDLRTHWGVTVVTKDRPSLLGNICGVLAANDLSIFSAQIFTRTDGVVIDTFRVLPLSSGTHFSEINEADILEDFTRVLGEKEALHTLLAQHQRRWKRRRLKKSGRPHEVVFDNQLSREFTIIDVFTDDALGLLYQIATALAESGVNIYSARISTRVDQVSDSFYVLDANGRKIVEPERQEKIRQNILQALRRRL